MDGINTSLVTLLSFIWPFGYIIVLFLFQGYDLEIFLHNDLICRICIVGVVRDSKPSFLRNFDLFPGNISPIAVGGELISRVTNEM